MALEDMIDGPPTFETPATRRRRASRVRDVVYLQLLAVALCVVLGHSELWGCGRILEALAPAALALYFTIPVFPVVLIVLLTDQEARTPTAWLTVPLSLAMSFTQFLALLPLFQ